MFTLNPCCFVSTECIQLIDYFINGGMQVVAEERAGTAEEIAAVFVAALRAMGLLVRFVRCVLQLDQAS